MHPITSMALQRLALGLFTLFVVSVIIAGAVEFLPGDLAQEILGQSATPESVAAFRAEVGLDKPPVERYFSWLGGVAQGDFGVSLATKRSISDLISARLGNTLFLAGFAAVIAVPLAVTLGMLAALYRNTWFDRLVNVSTLSSISFPEFFVAYVLILFLSVGYGFDARWVLALLGLFLLVEGFGAFKEGNRIGHFSFFGSIFGVIGLALVVNAIFGWWNVKVGAVQAFPSISNISPDTPFGERIHRSFLPALTLTLVVTAHMMRMTRASIINLMASPFLITGVVVVEVVFVYPGLGQLLVDSVSKRDITVVQGCCLIFANPRLLHPK